MLIKEGVLVTGGARVGGFGSLSIEPAGAARRPARLPVESAGHHRWRRFLETHPRAIPRRRAVGQFCEAFDNRWPLGRGTPSTLVDARRENRAIPDRRRGCIDQRQWWSSGVLVINTG
jgi:hypothetical protein